jgi:hypothetical protein
MQRPWKPMVDRELMWSLRTDNHDGAQNRTGTRRRAGEGAEEGVDVAGKAGASSSKSR